MADEYTLSKTIWERHLLLPSWIKPLDGQVIDTPNQAYVVFYPDPGRMGGDQRSGGLTRQLNWGWFATLVGRDRAQLMDTVRTYRSHFLNYRPDSSDSACPVWEDELGAGIQRESTVPSDTRFSTVLRFRLTTTRS